MYEIKENYIHRTKYHHWDDMNFEDQWQKEVYQKALTLVQEDDRIADIGCGSGYKLMRYFREKHFIGYEIEPTLSKLRERYPNRYWGKSGIPLLKFDIVICSDVIEHVLDPDELINYLKTANARDYVISTPDRDLVYGGEHNGPPRNGSHIREWNYEEFGRYLRKHFKTVEQSISNRSQFTQLAICRD
jgi:SAM-dependent methyltransferase